MDEAAEPSAGGPTRGKGGHEIRAEHAASLLDAQNRILRMIASGEPLVRVLDQLIRFMEAEAGEAICSVLLLDESGHRLLLGAAPSLPDAYNRAINGLWIGPETGSCGATVHRRQLVIVTDIEHDPLWKDYVELALGNGLRACTSSPILDSHGEVLGTFAFYYRTPRGPSEHDLELIEVSRDLAGIAIEGRRTLNRLEEAVRVRDDFLAIASHELKTPITTLLLQAGMLLRQRQKHPDAAVPLRDLGPKLELLERQAKRLERLVGEMLDVSRLVSGRFSSAREPVDLAEIAREVTGRLSPAFGGEQSPLQLEVEEPAVGLGDRAQLEQVLENLLSNALKFGNGQPVTVRVFRHDGCARVSVRDRGIGIAPEDQSRIFGKFERAVSARNYGGFGIGLWLSRELLTKMGGRITVDSQLGAGSTFTVELEGAGSG
ncbi:GAF domain-containing sensor histidine kinase [Polyangium aurulentum]|uniref:GAF domain-containing sensor histidine kinase n=1 Tax=Polyangium aurulentum TaxID=2567896 RepID=UPI0010ADC9CA|nr:GAF domain-containing sensor histidine kinase [Polyangium aurulentum]UQA57829.1 GAF domain-containing sensor histidine kinase [Polyangium aurulentum]